MFQKPVQHVTIDDLLNINLTRSVLSASEKTSSTPTHTNINIVEQQHNVQPEYPQTSVVSKETSYQNNPELSKVVCVASDEEYPGSNILWL